MANEHLTDPNYWKDPNADSPVHSRDWYVYGFADDPLDGHHHAGKPVYEGRHYFTIGERDAPRSTDFGIEIINDLELPSPERDEETIEIQGQEGVTVIDNGRYKPIRKEIRFVVRVPDEDDDDRGLIPFRGRTLHRRIREITSWIHSSAGYQKWHFSMYPRYTYYGRPTTFRFEDVSKHYARGTLDVELKPYMDEFTWKLVIGPIAQTVVDWEGDLAIRPHITIYADNLDEVRILKEGTNQLWLHLLGKYPGEINGDIRIDCEKRTVTKSWMPANWLLQHDHNLFPYINPGDRFGLYTIGRRGEDEVGAGGEIEWQVRRLAL